MFNGNAFIKHQFSITSEKLDPPTNLSKFFRITPFFLFLGFCPLSWIDQAFGSEDHLQDAGGEPSYQKQTCDPQPGQVSLDGSKRPQATQQFLLSGLANTSVLQEF